jgi:1-acyl-sn-glycerol-3-phosphate acyltransferase
MTLMQRLSRGILHLLGWTCADIEARPARAVLVVYPHTSNWDFPLGLLAKAALPLNARWAGKDSLFRGPLGPLMRWLGGIPVNRRERTGFVARLAGELRTEPPFLLAIAPEGTRSLTPGWKSGFYRIALAAEVPLLLATIDYAHKRIGIIGSFTPSGDAERDIAALAGHFAECRGLRHELASPIRLV